MAPSANVRHFVISFSSFRSTVFTIMLVIYLGYFSLGLIVVTSLCPSLLLMLAM